MAILLMSNNRESGSWHLSGDRDEIEIKILPSPTTISGPTVEADEEFPGGCPPQQVVKTAVNYQGQPVQSFSKEFLNLLEPIELPNGVVGAKLETSNFCVFEINGLIFGEFDGHLDVEGRWVSGQEFRDFLDQRGIQDDICQIIWARCQQEPIDPETPEVPNQQRDRDHGAFTDQFGKRLSSFVDIKTTKWFNKFLECIGRKGE
ncbi:MAG: hypothetical protein WD187_00700 [Candidatus Woykebacteria bacterium]